MLQRFHDWRLERRIRRLTAELMDALIAHDKPGARRIDAERMQSIRSRSPGQVERMEKRMGIRHA